MRLIEAKSQRRLATDGGDAAAAVRRLLDVVLAAAALIVLAPLMVLIALAVRAESPGPVFFSQLRLGEGGRLFRLHKFRKFHDTAPASGAPLTLPGDDRMTRVGRVLAHSKLDELPQFWNVLTGDMSLVGPRPESLAFADCFAERYRAVLNIRPGIFGPNQVLFRDESSFYRTDVDPEQLYRDVLFPLKARADLAYFPYRTLRGDLAWIARGILAVVGVRLPSDRGPDPAASIEAWRGQRSRG